MGHAPIAAHGGVPLLYMGDEVGPANDAGYAGDLPEIGQCVSVDGWVLEVVDRDGRRIDKLLVRRAAGAG